MRSIFEYLGRLVSGHQYSGATELFDSNKQSRATYLARLDRQLTSDEWAEFGRLVEEGY